MIDFTQKNWKRLRVLPAKRLMDKKKSGFTLIELLVSLSIFIVFLGVVSQSYISIVRSQREANNVRRTYSEVRNLMETLVEDGRLNSPDYDCYEQSSNLQLCPADITNELLMGSENYLVLINKNLTEKTVYRYNPDLLTIQVKRYQKNNDNWAAVKLADSAQTDQEGYVSLLSPAIKVKGLIFLLYPLKNPYSHAHYAENQYQFQPHVQVLLTVETPRNNLPPFVMNLQTSFSSRVYSPQS